MQAPAKAARLTWSSRVLGAAVALPTVLLAVDAGAQSPAWIAPESCPEPRWQHQSPPSESQPAAKRAPLPALSPRVEVEVVGVRWRARLTDPGDLNGAEREFWGTSCSEVTRAVEVAWSLWVEAERSEPTAPVEGAQAPGSEGPPLPLVGSTETREVVPKRGSAPAPTDVPAGTRPAAPTAARAQAPVKVSQPAATGAVMGLLAPTLETHGAQSVLGGAALGALGLEREWAWKVHVAGLLGRPRTSVGPLELTSLAASGDLCARLSEGTFGLCAGPRIEVLRAVASQIAEPRSSFGVLPSLAASALISTDPAKPVSWLFELGAYARLRAARFVLESQEDVYALPSWGVMIRVGPAVHL